MKIVKLGLNLIQKNSNKLSRQKAGFANRKTPRYLYHLTNQENLAQILKDGKLKISNCDEIDGVFMFNIQNLFKRWRFDIDEELKDFHIGLALLAQALKNNKNVFVLRIPTKALKHENLKVRSQKTLLSDTKEAMNHRINGVNIEKSRHFTEKKEALEYIYTDEIPVTQANVIGNANIQENIFETFFNNSKDRETQKDFFTKSMKALFENTPESKNINYLL